MRTFGTRRDAYWPSVRGTEPELKLDAEKTWVRSHNPWELYWPAASGKWVLVFFRVF